MREGTLFFLIFFDHSTHFPHGPKMLEYSVLFVEDLFSAHKRRRCQMKPKSVSEADRDFRQQAEAGGRGSAFVFSYGSDFCN